MAKYERSFFGNFEHVLDEVHNGILSGSISATYEDGSDYCIGNVCCAVRVYERYSYLGGNRVSMNLTLLGEGTNLHLSIITSGGSQGVFLKINTWGEESFLDSIRELVDSL